MSDNNKEHINVLSIDGGGIRGVIPSTYLAAIEEALDRPAHEIFHTIGGTSTGGIVSVFLSVPSTLTDKNGQRRILAAHEITEFYKTEGKKIFPAKWLNLGKSLIISIILAIGTYFLGCHLLSEYDNLLGLLEEELILCILFCILAFLTLFFLCQTVRFWTLPKFSAKPLEDAFYNRFDSETTLANAKTNVGIVSTDIRYVKPFVFNSVRAKKISIP